MSAEWITYKGKSILLIKYSGLSPTEQIEQIKKATQILIDTKATNNLTLTDLHDTPINQDFVATANEKGKISGPLTKKAAIVGIQGIKKILLKAVNTMSGNQREPFATIEEAKEWLVK
jgi:hypothetical protein